MGKGNRIKQEKKDENLDKLFIGMDQKGTRFSGTPQDLLHLFLSSQIDLVKDVFMPDGNKTDRINFVKSMAHDVIKVLEDENEKDDTDTKDDSGEDEQSNQDFQI